MNRVRLFPFLPFPCPLELNCWCLATGTLPKLPGNNPVQPAGAKATVFPATSTPALLSPIFAYTGDQPTQVGKVQLVVPEQSNPTPGSAGPVAPSAPTTPSTPSTPVSSTAPSMAPTPSTSVSMASVPHATRPHRNPPVYFPPLPATPSIPPTTKPTPVNSVAPKKEGSPPSSGGSNPDSGSCSGGRNKRQNGMHKHRRSTFSQFPHVRHYDYVYDMN